MPIVFHAYLAYHPLFRKNNHFVFPLEIYLLYLLSLGHTLIAPEALTDPYGSSTPKGCMTHFGKTLSALHTQHSCAKVSCAPTHRVASPLTLIHVVPSAPFGKSEPRDPWF